MRLRTVKAKLPKSIKRITILKSEGAGGGGMVVKQKRKKKKQSKGLVKVWERYTRRSAKAEQKSVDTYLSRHRRSNRKHRDGWLRDYTYNWARSRRKGNKKLKLSKLWG